MVLVLYAKHFSASQTTLKKNSIIHCTYFVYVSILSIFLVISSIGVEFVVFQDAGYLKFVLLFQICVCSSQWRIQQRLSKDQFEEFKILLKISMRFSRKFPQILLKIFLNN